MWRCQIVGKINKIDNTVAKVNRFFDGYKWLSSNSRSVLTDLVMKELAKRKDKGDPWRGDAVKVITPMNAVVEVYIPHEEDIEENWKEQQAIEWDETEEIREKAQQELRFE